jgi:hypothetical protein
MTASHDEAARTSTVPACANGGHEAVNPLLAVGINDHVKGVGVVDHGLSLDGDAVTGRALRRQMRKQHLTHLRIPSGAAFPRMLVACDEEGHQELPPLVTAGDTPGETDLGNQEC